MFASIRNRMVVIVALVGLAIFYLFPRPETVRRQLADGRMQDTVMTRVPLKLGLDLQGGMHLELELDESEQVSADRVRDTDLALTVLRKRIDEFGVAEPVIQKVGDERIIVELAGIRDPDRAKGIVQSTAALEFRITDETRALDNALPAMDRVLAQMGIAADAPAGPSAASQVTELLGGTRDTQGVALGDTAAAPAVDSTTTDTAPTAAPTPAPTAGGPVLQSLIQPSSAYGFDPIPGEYAVVETAFVRVDSLLRIPEVERLLPRSVEWRWAGAPTAIGTEQVRMLYVLEDEPIITGDRLESATPQIDPMTNRPIVSFTLDRAGGRRFGAETGRHVGDYMAIILDNRVQGRAPRINSRIDRSGQIEMAGRDIREAQDLALTLNAGALPIPLKVVRDRQVGASLGQDSIRSGITALIAGTVLVILIMMTYYRLAGVLAVSALGLYILFTLAGLSAIDATLTLPGLAGLVLSIGIAVDANVLIFERIREELIAGRTVRLAVSEGFQHAMSAIVDSNVSTVLTALFLFQFGTGPVKGFAVTLIMGIAASMFTAIFVTKTFFLIWLDRKDSQATSLSI
ncbi:MAG: protein translocase subunit SecD [Gemmatimonadetes bacterium]|nr:protein translocase subunit SecD [Gemmatimonadota bacterium]MCB9504914.1 protein translocase subunit SecD [Gemmatimonadales bacterium]MCA9762920.1 protein translocase subunit SecD [Gemmatimonadota bacterium]MCA9768699.1 protein translocase subunit SecD [Gemmatimonadota bacterium]MCB9518234.1 protein translocase subunit SecD [Gemmatimonadales bacterium]